MKRDPSQVLFVVLIAIASAVVATPVWAQATDKVLHTFTLGKDGNYPQYPVVFDQAGNLYGTTFFGGVYDQGIVFMLSPTPSGPWKETVLYRFTGGRDGGNPGGLAIGSSGTVYGFAEHGGTPTRGTPNCQQHGCGTLFKLTSTPSGWRFNLLHAFTGVSDGAWPNGLTLDSSGNLYVTTWEGGPANAGAVFAMTPTSSGLKGTSVHVFTGPDGISPTGGVLVDSAGNLFGTTTSGGPSTSQGEFYELTPTAGGWVENTLYSFTGSGDGGEPLGPLVRDSAGNFFGAMRDVSYINGAIFEISPGSAGWSESVVYAFSGGSDGALPEFGVVIDATGNLYGTTLIGGIKGCQNGSCGVAFELSQVSGTWTYTVLYSFTGGADGAEPEGVVLDSAGNLVGVADAGGKTVNTICGCGVVFELPGVAAAQK